MLSVQIKTELFDIKDSFSTEEGFTDGFRKMRELLSMHKRNLTHKEIDILIDIYKDALKNSYLTCDENEWKNKHSIHFKGCSNSNKIWQTKFCTDNYEYRELQDFVDAVKTYRDYEFLLRVPEVVLKEVAFSREVRVLGRTYNSILDDIVKGKYR